MCNIPLKSLCVYPLSFLAIAFLAACQSAPDAKAPYSQEMVERGEYLVTIALCNDCHTPYVMGAAGPEPDMTRMLSGHPEDLDVGELPMVDGNSWWVGFATNTAFAGPWGISYTANLTPDENTGTGIWTEQMFVSAIRTGKHMGTSRPIQPPMPWQWFAKMSDEDLVSIYAYLRSIPPLKNRVPETLNAEELQARTRTRQTALRGKSS